MNLNSEVDMSEVRCAYDVTSDQTNFAGLIGSQARLAKEIDLWWRLEILTESIILASDDEEKKGCSDSEGAGSESKAADDRLVRTKNHTMPFLIRNFSNCPFHSNSLSMKEPHCRRRPCKNRRATRKTALTSDVISYCFGIGSPNKSKRKRQSEKDSTSSPGLIRSIRQKINGWFSSAEKEEQPTSIENEKQYVPKKLSSADTEQSTQYQANVHPLTAYELFAQSQQVRQMILDEIDPALHHDEEFICNRFDACWTEMTSDIHNSQEKMTGNQNGTGNNTTTTQREITKHAYWIDMENKGKKRFLDAQFAHQNNGQRSNGKVSNFGPQTWTDTNQSLSRHNRGKNRPVYFHYMYMNANNHPSTAVEKRHDLKCPFCIFSGKSNEELIWHCGVFHGVLTDYHPCEELWHGLCIQSVLDEEQGLHVVVRRMSFGTNKLGPAGADNFVFVRTAGSSKTDYSIPFLLRSHTNAAAMDPIIRRRRLLALEANDAPISVISSYLPTDEVPIRQYFHSRTNLPMEEWNDVDSDDESDDEWLHKMNADLMEEFEDVSEKEKKLMQMWNRFIKSHVVIADRSIPGKCMDFISAHLRELREGEMRNNLLLHLTNLWDAGVISSARIAACMELYDEGIISKGMGAPN